MDTMGQNRTVIVTSGKSRVAYNIVRSLGRRGCRVFVGDVESGAMSAASRYAQGSFVYPSPFSAPVDFKECLLRKIKELEAEVLIPVLEETFLVAQYREELAHHVKLVVPEYDQILDAHNKDSWGSLADELDIPHPRAFAVTTLQANTALCHELRFPVLLKPKQGGGGWAIQEVTSVQELQGLLATESNGEHSWDRFFVQEKIDGETHCVATLFCKGELRGMVAYRQLREYPVPFGQAVMRQSIRSEQAEGNIQKLLGAMKWHGVCQADFVVDSASGIPFLIDINPRFWGSVAQAIASGVDFPWLLYQIAHDGDVESVTNFATGVKSRWIGGDLRAFLPLLGQSPDKIKFLRDFFSVTNWQVYRDDFEFQDPLPFFSWVAYSVRCAVKRRFADGPAADRLQGVWE
ncbi:MAG: ATP-grasp domain-containing protein [Thermodesulfobacteriota bacterium]